MQYRNLGRTGIKVSRLCLGTMNFGPITTEEDSFRIMDQALDLGINFFDTADVYGWKKGEGITENIIGRWFAQGGGRREKVVLATKLYGDMGEWPNQSRLSALYIRRACDASLKRLQTDYIDLYQMHHIWREVSWDEAWEAFERLAQQGKIVYMGSSNFAGWHIAQANEAAKNRHFLGLVSEQCRYHLNARLPELDLLPACASYGLGVIPWSPLDGGFLGGMLKKIAEGRRASEDMQKRVERERTKLEQWEGLCAELGHEPGQVALAWLLHNDVVTAPIIGPRTAEQLDGATGALDVSLSPEIMDRLNVIFPGHRPAPEGFAW